MWQGRLFLGQFFILLQYGGKLVQGHLATAHLDEKEHTVSDHAPQKSVAGDGDAHAPLFFIDKQGAVADLANGVVVEVRLLAQWFAIRGGLDQGCCFFHEVDIQGQVFVEVAVSNEDRIFFPVDKIIVGPGNGIISGVLILVDFYYFKDCDVIREVFIQPILQVKGGRIVQVDMQDILAGMYTGIGAPTAIDDNVFFKQLEEGLLDYFLDSRQGVLLFLPTTVVAPVKSEVYEIAH